MRAATIAAFVTACAVLVLRYPTALFAAEPLWEDGPIFYVRGFEGLKVGQHVQVELTHTDVARGFIDFTAVGKTP